MTRARHTSVSLKQGEAYERAGVTRARQARPLILAHGENIPSLTLCLERTRSLSCCCCYCVLQNKWRHSNHFMVLSFFVVSASMVLALNGDMQIMSGVFCLSFLGVLVRLRSISDS